MVCKNCGTEFEGGVCSHCGKGTRPLWRSILAVLILVLFVFPASMAGSCAAAALLGTVASPAAWTGLPGVILYLLGSIAIVYGGLKAFNILWKK